jgi:hypothetical protein
MLTISISFSGLLFILDPFLGRRGLHRFLNRYPQSIGRFAARDKTDLHHSFL